MPLRSVEAASREDAIAAAREQFGPMARVIGVRRVRSGGVLGFFATERYVAEVEPDNRPRLGSRPAGPRDDGPPGRQGSLAERAAELAAYLQEQESDQRVDEIAELFAGGPAATPTPTYSRSGVQAPSTSASAATAWPAAGRGAAAEPAARTVGPSFPTTSSSSFAAVAAPAAPPAAAAPAAPAAPAPDEDEPFLRAAFPRTSRKATAAPAGEPGSSAILRETADAQPLPPSPFTAALARMVSGDREVQKAVRDALEGQLAGDPGPHGGPWSTERGHAGTTEMATGAQRLSTGAGHQEEKPVSELETMSGAAVESFPGWATQPPAQAPAETSSREEAIAQVLRSALAQHQTDEVLADILRRVLADASSEPAATAPAAPEPAWIPAPEPLWSPVTQSAGWAAVESPVETPAPQVASLPPVPVPVAGMPTAAPAPAPMPTMPVPIAQIPTMAAQPAGPLAEIAPDEPIWAEVVLHEPAPAPAPAAPVDTTAAAPTASPAPTASTAPTAASLAEAIRAQIVRGQEPVPAAQVPAAPATVTLAAAGAPAAPSAPSLEARPVGAAPEPAAAARPAVPLATQEIPSLEPAAEAVTPEESAAAQEIQPAAAEPANEAAPAAAEEAVAPPEAAQEPGVAEVAEVALPEMARTASDPAPLPLDATTIMPPLSLLPPLPSSRRAAGRPPVPPPSRPPVPPADSEPETERRREELLATVTRLPVAPVESETDAAREPELDLTVEPQAPGELTLPDEAAADEPQLVESQLVEPEAFEPAGDPFGAVFRDEQPPAPSAPVTAALSLDPPVVVAPREPLGDVVTRLLALGIPREVLGTDFAAQAEAHGTYAALTAALAARLPQAPPPPTGAGEVLFVVGPGVATLRAARSLAVTLGLHPHCVQWASRGELAGLAPQDRRMATIDAAIDRRQEAAAVGTVTIVAVDAPLRTDAYWMAQMLAVWTPVAVWAVVEATRKPEDLGPWLAELPRVDALVLQDTDLSVDPAAVLEQVSVPVALLDGGRATPHRWASLLCERLETDRT